MTSMYRLLITAAAAGALLAGCAHPPVGPDNLPPAPQSHAQTPTAGTIPYSGGDAARSMYWGFKNVPKETMPNVV